MNGEGSGRGPADPLAQLRHDLRTQVNQILGYSELLEEEAQDAGSAASVPTLQRIQSAARRQLELIEGLRALPQPPASPAPPPAQTQPQLRIEPVDSAAPASGELLVVDDNEMNRDMLSRRLRHKGYRVEVAEDGEQALRMLASRSFDLVILDVMMPGISGLEVLVRLRADRSASDLPVIMATARDTSEDVVEALRMGANDYVTKPLDFPVVLARVQAQLALKRQADRIRELARDLDLRNRFIQHTFGRFVSDEVVRGLLETPEGL
ncbi:MAG: response regulator, partial [Deltaproteobacteria bacterium]|nr:response regulator [Deltaproteobacteria bacterium]